MEVQGRRKKMAIGVVEGKRKLIKYKRDRKEAGGKQAGHKTMLNLYRESIRKCYLAFKFRTRIFLNLWVLTEVDLKKQIITSALNT